MRRISPKLHCDSENNWKANGKSCTHGSFFVIASPSKYCGSTFSTFNTASVSVLDRRLSHNRRDRLNPLLFTILKNRVRSVELVHLLRMQLPSLGWDS